MKIEEIYKAIEPMFEELELDDESAIMMLGSGKEKMCGLYRGRSKVMARMLAMQMLREKDIAEVVFHAVEVFIAANEEKLNEKSKQQKLS